MDTTDLDRAAVKEATQPAMPESQDNPSANENPPTAGEILVMPWKPPMVVPQKPRDFRDWGINE